MADPNPLSAKMRLRLFMEGTGGANRAVFEVFRLVGAVADLALPARRASRCAEREFDARAGIVTTGRLSCAALGVKASPAAAEAWHYAGVDSRVLEEALGSLPADFAATATFADYGSGKGRALAVASLRGFRRVIGVEFSPVLHRVATANAERFRLRHPTLATWELLNGDARDFEIPEGPVVLHLYNPFRGEVFDAVMRRIAAHRGAGPLYIVYCNPLYADRLKALVPARETARFAAAAVFLVSR